MSWKQITTPQDFSFLGIVIYTILSSNGHNLYLVDAGKHMILNPCIYPYSYNKIVWISEIMEWNYIVAKQVNNY